MEYIRFLPLVNIAVFTLTICMLTEACPIFPPERHCKDNQSIVYSCYRQNRTKVPGNIDSSVECLDLGENNFQYLEDEAFKNFTNLKELYLDNNLLKTLSIELFRYNINLQNLNLNGNQLETLDELLFRQNRHLVDLNVDKNRLKTFNGNAFKYNKDLIRLSLFSNNLQKLTLQLLYNPSLFSLSLGSNQLRYLQADAFSDCGNITLLDLEQNLFKRLPSELFKDCTSLQYLQLNKNNLQTLPSDIFKYNTLLVTIKLIDNELEELSPSIFEYNTNLKRLYLSGNRIKMISFELLYKLSHVYIFECHECLVWNCELMDLYNEWMDNDPFNASSETHAVQQFNRITCKDKTPILKAASIELSCSDEDLITSPPNMTIKVYNSLSGIVSTAVSAMLGLVASSMTVFIMINQIRTTAQFNNSIGDEHVDTDYEVDFNVDNILCDELCINSPPAGHQIPARK